MKPEKLSEAKAAIDACPAFLCCMDDENLLHSANRKLYKHAVDQGKIIIRGAKDLTPELCAQLRQRAEE